MALREDRWYYRLAVELLVKMKSHNQAIAVAQLGVLFLERTHPAEWEVSVSEFKNDIKKFSKIK